MAAVREGWPRVLEVNRSGADARRDRLLRRIPTRPGIDRDEYPPAVARGKARSRLPRGGADVAYVPSSENRSHGATHGVKLRRYCDGTRFRYVFYSGTLEASEDRRVVGAVTSSRPRPL